MARKARLLPLVRMMWLLNDSAEAAEPEITYKLECYCQIEF